MICFRNRPDNRVLLKLYNHW